VGGEAIDPMVTEGEWSHYGLVLNGLTLRDKAVFTDGKEAHVHCLLHELNTLFHSKGGKLL